MFTLQCNLAVFTLQCKWHGMHMIHTGQGESVCAGMIMCAGMTPATKQVYVTSASHEPTILPTNLGLG